MVVPLNDTSKVNLSPSTFPLLMAIGSPCGPWTVPVKLPPSCLKVKVNAKLLPSGVFISADQVPVTSAAKAVAAVNDRTRAAQKQRSFFIDTSRPIGRRTHDTADRGLSSGVEASGRLKK